MARPHFMIAIGLPSSPHGDEDNLDREHNGNANDDDPATQTISAIMHALLHRGPGAVRSIKMFADALAEMGDAAMSRDDEEFEQQTTKAHRYLCDLIYR